MGHVLVDDKIYNLFIDTGFVPNEIINMIAIKIINKTSLNQMEMSIFYNKTNEINQEILNLQKTFK
jgi:hypothetical protein